MRILFIGDIFGRPGRQALASALPGLKKSLGVDLVVANGENGSGGLGLNARAAGELFVSGVNVITSGNHIWRHKDLVPLLEDEPHLLRPHNYPGDAPGRGWVVARLKKGVEVAVVNLEGRAFMTPLDCPFRGLDALLEGPLRAYPIRVLDFHAEATSEKLALAWHADGRLSALVGTHTHVQTADEKILPRGTAYITDLGLTGPHHSVIGMEPSAAVSRFLTQRPQRFVVARRDLRLQGALVEIDETTGRAREIRRISQALD
ncbi:MAG: TIGR00282 family metallophosphoesterase [Deltaproteobacteria bacterium]|nr:TIGR00282 family metallophosphoesterase [Deltaproteobacteria bacterium]